MFKVGDVVVRVMPPWNDRLSFGVVGQKYIVTRVNYGRSLFGRSISGKFPDLEGAMSEGFMLANKAIDADNYEDLI